MKRVIAVTKRLYLMRHAETQFNLRYLFRVGVIPRLLSVVELKLGLPGSISLKNRFLLIMHIPQTFVEQVKRASLR